MEYKSGTDGFMVAVKGQAQVRHRADISVKFHLKICSRSQKSCGLYSGSGTALVKPSRHPRRLHKGTDLDDIKIQEIQGR